MHGQWPSVIKSTKAYTIPCERAGCHNWFLSVEHMRSHMKNSSCNPDRQRSVDKDKVVEFVLNSQAMS